MDAAERLCLACGMCCDGTLFDTVRFGPGENAAALKARGLPVKRSRAKVPISFFKQPCRALCEDLKCQVYQDRPQQCRSFECGLFKELAAEEINLDAALRVVKKARRKASQARRLLCRMGEEDERSSLGLRLRRVQRQIESGRVDASAGEVFADLSLVMHQLDLLAHQRFYTT